MPCHDSIRAPARVLATAIAAVLLTAPGPAAATDSLVECIEGAEFIANAAASRDNGMSREAYLDRLEQGFVAIRAFPVAPRWFVEDADDERFLRSSVESVYDRPTTPDGHHAAFFAACVSRGAA